MPNPVNPLVQAMGGPGPGGDYYCNKNFAGNQAYCTDNSFKADAKNPDGTYKSTYQMGPNGACGTLTYCNENELCKDQNSLGCISCKTQKEALDYIINTIFLPIATQTEQTDYSYRNFYINNDPSAATGFDSGWIYNYCQAIGVDTDPAQCCVPGVSTTCVAATNLFADFSIYNDKRVQDPAVTTVQSLYWPYSVKKLAGDDNFIDLAQKYYHGQIEGVAADYATNMAGAQGTAQTNQSTQSTAQYNYNTIFDDAIDKGWIYAGSFYYLISQMNNKNQSQALPEFTIKQSATPSTGDYKDYRSNYGTAGALLRVMAGEKTTTTGTGTPGTGGAAAPASSAAAGSASSTLSGMDDAPDEMGDMGDAVGDSFSSSGSALNSSLNSYKDGVNPLVALQATGYALLLAVTILYPILIFVSFALGTVASLNAWFPGGEGAFLPIQGGLILLYFFLVPALMALMAMLISLGALLGVYVPLIPYIIFTFGAIGWMLSVIEAMVAGPLVALGIMAPAGHHEILGKAEHGLMMLFTIFLRPSLMIFGLIASMALAIVAVLLVNETFGFAITTMSNPGAVGNVGSTTGHSQAGATALAFNPLMLIIILCTYVMLIITVLNKCFAAIHVVPERVMSWIGAQGAQYGEEESLRSVKGGTDAGAGAMKEFGAKAEKGAEGAAKKKADDRKKPETDIT
jgi:hypothetical protein